MIGVLLDHWHRVTRVSHLGKNDQLGARLLSSAGKVANFGQIRFRIAERARDLSNSDFHFIVILSEAKLNAADEVREARLSISDHFLPELPQQQPEMFRFAQHGSADYEMSYAAIGLR
jgi:hypothetical protein